VKSYVHVILDKLGVHGRAQAISESLRRGIVRPDD